MRRVAAGLGVVALLAGACIERTDAPGARISPAPTPTKTLITTDQGGKAKPGPAGITLVFETGPFEQRLFQATVRDLVRVGVWRKLTRGLHSVELETHPGARSKAGVHLADAVLSHAVLEGKPLVVCDIRFYPRAIRQELRLFRRVKELGLSPDEWRDYNDNGVFDEPTPDKSDFWASILAHELSHCLVGPHGEQAAQAWEYKTMRRLRSRGPRDRAV